MNMVTEKSQNVTIPIKIWRQQIEVIDKHNYSINKQMDLR